MAVTLNDRFASVHLFFATCRKPVSIAIPDRARSRHQQASRFSKNIVDLHGWCRYIQFAWGPSLRERQMSLLDVDSLDPEAGTLQRFGTDKDADFKFMPQELSARCRALIESYHAINGYARLPDMLWHSDARGVIECHPELARTFKTASKSRCAKRANGVFISIATFIASLEMLAGDFAGWGGRFPEAKREAEAYLAESTLQRRLWFIEKYLYPSHNAQRDLGEGLTPAAPDRY